MKTTIKLLAISAILFIGNLSFSQPSDSEIKARVLRDGAKTVKFYGTGKVTTTSTETYYFRSFEATWDTDYPGVTQRVSMEYKYNKNGGSWSFTKEFIVEVLYDGIPNPTEDEIMVLINSNKKKFLGSAYTDIVGEVDYIKLADEPKWMWESVTRTSFLVEASFDRKMSSTELKKVKQVYRVSLYADVFKGPWVSLLSMNEGYPEVLSTQTFSAEELRNMPTLSDMAYIKEAEAIMAALPKITIPDFTNTKEVIVHTFKLLRESTLDEFKAYMYQMLTPNFFADNSKVLNSYGERIFDDMISVFDPKTAFKDQYCENPKIKSDGETSMEFYNREKRMFTRINVKEIDGKFLISAISAGVYVKDEDVSRVKALGDVNCGDAINTTPVVVSTYKIGDKVEVKSRGSWYPGVIDKIDSNMDDRYFIKCTEINSLWLYTSDIRMATGGGNETEEKDDNNLNDSGTGTGTGTGTKTNDADNNGNSDNNVDDDKKDDDKKKIKIDPNKAKGIKKKIKIGG